MPFPPELQEKIDAIRSRSSDVSDRAAELRRKLAARQGRGGFAQNAADIEAALTQEQNDAVEES
jgi:hypothetical protein